MNVDFSTLSVLDLHSFMFGVYLCLFMMAFYCLIFTGLPMLCKLLVKLTRKVWKRIMQKKKKQAEIDQDPADPR